jgi:hypothetical protein
MKKTMKRKVKRVPDDEYQRLLKKKRLTKKDRKRRDKALKQRYCACLKKLENNPKLKYSAFAICANSVYKKRGLPVPPNIARDCKK